MDIQEQSARRVELPPESRATGYYETTDLADAYSIALPDDAITDPEQLARFVLSHQPSWIDGLMHLRDALVAGFGIKTSKQLERADPGAGGQRIGIFKVYESGAQEVLVGEDDVHLDFRLSVMAQPGRVPGGRRLVLSTVVHCHNLLGRTYIALIAPFHRRVVQASLEHAARAGWPLRAGAPGTG